MEYLNDEGTFIIPTDVFLNVPIGLIRETSFLSQYLSENVELYLSSIMKKIHLE